MNDVGLVLGIVTGCLSILTTIVGVGAFLRGSARKEYASQRDMEHLKNNQAQLSANTLELWRQNDERFDSVDRKLERIETFLIGNISTDRSGHTLGKHPKE